MFNDISKELIFKSNVSTIGETSRLAIPSVRFILKLAHPTLVQRQTTAQVSLE